jgi:hypothetical protein
LGKDPSAEIMLLTYGEELTRVLANNVHHLMRHAAYMRLFPHTRCIGPGSQSQALRTSAGGKVHFTSVQGTMTGLGADWIILDDPLQAAHRRSDTRGDRLESTFREALSTRLNNPSTRVTPGPYLHYRRNLWRQRHILLGVLKAHIMQR